MPTQFATNADFAARLGLTLTAPEQARADTLLQLASAMIQDATGKAENRQTIELVTDDVLLMPGTTDEMIKLPQRPVGSVTSVTLDGLPLTEGTYWYASGNTIVRIPSNAVVLSGGMIFNFPFGAGYPYGSGFGWPAQTLAITYTHGYAPADIPQSLKAICMEMVVRVWVNPGAVIEERVGNMSTMYSMRSGTEIPGGLLLTDVESRLIRRMFGRTAGSVTVGR